MTIEVIFRIPTRSLIKSDKSVYNYIHYDVVDRDLNTMGVYSLVEVYDDISTTPAYELLDVSGELLAYAEYGDSVPEDKLTTGGVYIDISVVRSYIKL